MDFPNISPDWGTPVDVSPKIRKAQFGDGYEQRVIDGVNSMPRKWSLTYTDTEANIDTLEAFLKSTYGAYSFSWTPPRGAIGKWVIDSNWTRNVADIGYERIQVVFREVFEV